MLRRDVLLIRQHIRLLQRVPRKDHDPQRRRRRGMFADGRKSLNIILKDSPLVPRKFKPVSLEYLSILYEPIILSTMSITLRNFLEYLINRF